MKIEQYFQKSCVRSPNGELCPVYHGTHTPDIQSLTPDYKAQGNDQYGGGVYFSTSYDVACGYTNGDSGHVLECYLNITHPLTIDGARFSNLRNVTVSGTDAQRILCHHSGLYLPLDLDASATELNPMTDYLPNLPNIPLRNKADYQRCIRRMAREYFTPTNMLILDVFFGQRHGNEFRRAVQEVLGYDGVKVIFDTSAHYVAWFPEQIKLTSNTAPTASPNLGE